MLNLKNHERDFADVWQVFEDVNSKTYIDNREYDEERYVIFGIDYKGIVNVAVYTLRGENKRIISFRPANKKEMEMYYGN
ncbi:MAG: BrnT family toxin [Elusimicrobiota bacterium]|nr:BrnT family toxin [Elusimicrobiota bacterium]